MIYIDNPDAGTLTYALEFARKKLEEWDPGPDCQNDYTDLEDLVEVIETIEDLQDPSSAPLPSFCCDILFRLLIVRLRWNVDVAVSCYREAIALLDAKHERAAS